MKRTLPQLRRLAIVALSLFVAHSALAVEIWTGASGSDTNWSTANNWSGLAVPNSADAVQCFDDGANGTVSNINNVVDSGLTIASLQYGNTNNNHTTLIAPNQTLTVNGALIVGTETALDPIVAKTNVITGVGGKVVVNGSGNLIVRQGPAAATSLANRMTLDLSGLDTFSATVGRVFIGVGTSGGINRASGRLILARTNTITATSGTSPAFDLGESGSNNGNGSSLVLGQTNAIFADTITIGRFKERANNVFFNRAFTNSIPAPAVYFRGKDGVSRVTTFAIADGGSGTGTVNPQGTVDFTGGSVDAQVATLQVGRTTTGAAGASQTATGVLTFGAGTVDVDTLQNGFNTAGNTNWGNGTVNVNGTALLKVNVALELGRTVGAATAGGDNTKGTLAINGGTVNANTITANFASTNNAITMTNGTLAVTNTVGPGINTFSITNSTLTLAAQVGAAPTVTVTNLAMGGATNRINISSIPALLGYPVSFPLIKYSGAFAGTFNIGLGTLPAASPSYVGYISNHTATSTIELVLTTGPAPAKSITWSGNPSGDWDLGGTANWLTTNGIPTTYAQTDFVTFDDTATGSTTVSMTTGMAPSGITVSNNSKLYILNGDHLTGPIALVKQGSGTLILDNGGNNDFTGGVFIGAGTLQIGNADVNGNLPTTGNVTDNGTLAFSVGADITVSNVITGTGGITHNGGATLTLAGANSYTGAVSVASGSTLRVANIAALGATNGGTTISSGATFDVGGFGTANVANGLGAEQITVSGAGVNGSGIAGAIINGGSLNQQNILRLVTLAGDTTFGGSARWDIRGTPSTAALSTSGQPWKLTKVGPVQVSLVGVTVDPALGDVDVQSGTLSLETTSTGLGNPANTLTIESGATLQFFNLTNQLNKTIVLNGDGSTATVNNSSGANSVVGPMTLNGACVFTAGGTSLNLSNLISGSGSVTKMGTSTLILSGTANHTGGTTVTFGTLAVNGTLSGALTIGGGTTLTGTGTTTGAADVSGVLNPGTVNGAGALRTSGGLTLQGSATLTFDLSPTNTASGGVNDLLTVNGAFTTSGNPININVLQPQIKMQAGSYRLINYTGGLSGGFGGIQTVPASRYTLTLDTATAQQVNVNVSGSPLDLKWSSTTDTNWDVNVSANWLDPIGATNTTFFAGDTVLFDDTASVLTSIFIATNVAVLPTSVTNSSTLNNFTISGPGKISGSASIVKQGTSTFTLATSNDFSGTVTVLGGILKLGSTNALGTTNGGTIISSGATLELNNFSAATEPVTVIGAGVGGNGAIINTTTNVNGQQNAFLSLTLAGDTTIGGQARWDIRATGGTTGNPSNANLRASSQPYNLTKVGTNFIGIVSVTVDPNLGDVNIQGGTLDFEGNTTSLGDPNKTVTVSSNAILLFFNATNRLNKKIVLNDGGVIQNSSGTNFVYGPVTLNGSNLFLIGGTSLNFTNVLSGTGSLTKSNANQLILSGASTYSGNTLVGAGALVLSGVSGSIASSPTITIAAGAALDATARPDATMTLVSGQTLYGNGTNNGTLAVSLGASVSPGAAPNTVGILTVAGSVALSGTTRMEIDRGNNTNDLLRSTSGTLTYGGTLSVPNLSGTLALNDSFKLFNAANYAGGFTNIVPATPGAGLAWDTSALLTTGTLKVITGVVNSTHITGVTVTGSNLVLSGTGGTAGSGFSVYTSTDVSLPLTSWTLAGSGVFDGSGNFSFPTGINPATPARFFILRVP